MASKIVALACLLLAVINTGNTQCINRLIPGCGSNLIPITETFTPNQLLLNPGYMPTVPNIDTPYGVETLLQNQLLQPTTIIQDSTVANNLANALQLLVVSNLLSNTLTSNNDVVVGGCHAPTEYFGNMVSPVSPYGYGPYNYIY